MLNWMSLRAVIVDDSAEFLQAARLLLEREGVTVAGSAATGAGALRSIAEQDPDVVLVDAGLGEESGFAVAEQLARVTGGHARVIVISAYPEQDFRDLIDASPAIGFVPKSRLSADAITALLGRSQQGGGEAGGEGDGGRPDAAPRG